MKTSLTFPPLIGRSLRLGLAALAALLLLSQPCAQAVILGPYSRDADTLHLWHLDEAAVPALDSAPGGTNLTALGGSASLANGSYSGFGSALSTASTTGDYLAARPLTTSTADDTTFTFADATTGAFTFEALLRVDFNPATFNRGSTPLYIITGENDAGTRPWQFRIHTNGVAGSGVLQLQLLNLGVGNTPFFATIPSSGQDAIAQGQWFHVAVTFDGAAAGGHLNFYWTLLDPSRQQANLIGSTTMANLTPMATGNFDFAIGNVGRNAPGGNFVGRLDEVRISKIARSQTELMFGLAKPCLAVSIVSGPVAQSVELRLPVSLSVLAYGSEPLSYQWSLNGSPLAGATQSVCSFSSMQQSNQGAYSVTITNGCPSSATSEPAALTAVINPPSISTQPLAEVVAFGQPASFSVLAGGTPPLFYQWRFQGAPIAGATNSLFSLASVQGSNGGLYDVVITNESPVSATSDAVSLTVRPPRLLSWLGGSDQPWDTSTTVWDSNADLNPDAIYTEGDSVRFDDSAPADSYGYCSFPLDVMLHPSAVVVSNNSLIYEMKGLGGLSRNGSLKKQGSGSLAVGMDNSFSGPTTIEAGTLMVGLGGNSTRGSLGSGPITNQALLLFDRTGTLAMSNAIAGSGELIKTNTLSLRLLATNSFSGPVRVKRGNLTVGPGALANVTSLSLDGVGAGDGTSLALTPDGLGQAAVLPAGLTITTSQSDDNNRAGILNETGTNIINSTIVVNGFGVLIVRTVAGSMEINGPISGPNFTNNYISLRGAGINFMRGQLTLPNGSLQKDDSGTWVLSSVGNTFKKLRMIGSGGTLKLGAHNALDPACYIESDNGSLDLAGFNQTVQGLSNTVAQAGTLVTNSSSFSDSRLSLVNSLAQTFGPSACVLGDGARKVSLSVAIGGTQILTNVCTFSGDTTLTAGVLALTNRGTLLNSTPISIGAAATLDVSARTNGTFSLGAAQLLKGDGSFVGHLASQGTLAPGNPLGTLSVSGNVALSGPAKTLMQLNNATATKALLQVAGSLSYGGSLIISNLSATPYSANQVIKLFQAGAYSGAFTNISFAGVALFDASALTLDGSIKVLTPLSMAPVSLSSGLSLANKLSLAWPSDHTTWKLLVQTNAPGSGLSTNWLLVAGSASTNQVLLPIDPAQGSVFYRLVYP